jgi:hypothetical protein
MKLLNQKKREEKRQFERERELVRKSILDNENTKKYELE